MSYTALYRKFRPQVFEDVKGQDHIVTTLKNQLNAQRIGHAYLFCGTRGTGKTTIAKIFARAVNCEHPTDGSPCGECPSCSAILAGNSMNVIEIDAASNNGVENIREIKEEVTYSPTEGNYKVYIIDEVHMLSIGAFNALLKTLEEPPSYVIFILATTEVNKIPVTILSRCQRYDFRRITVDTISERLRELVEKEQVAAEEKALRYIAKAADGAMRDALSLLDQCIAFHLGEELTYDKVLKVLGAVDTEVFARMLRHILQQEIVPALAVLEELIWQGRELGQFVVDFTWYLRNLLLLKSSDDMEEVLDISSENLIQLKEIAQIVDTEQLLRYIRIFSELSNNLRYSAQKRILIEITIIKLCKPQMETNQDALADRIRQMEMKLEQGIPSVSVAASPIQPAAAPKPAERPQLPKAVPKEVQEAVKNWRTVIKRLSPFEQTYLRKARLSLAGDNKIKLVFEEELAVSLLGEEEHRRLIEQAIEDTIGKSVEVMIEKNDSQMRFEDAYADLEDLFGMEVVTEEE